MGDIYIYIYICNLQLVCPCFLPLCMTGFFQAVAAEYALDTEELEVPAELNVGEADDDLGFNLSSAIITPAVQVPDGLKLLCVLACPFLSQSLT